MCPKKVSRMVPGRMALKVTACGTFDPQGRFGTNRMWRLERLAAEIGEDTMSLVSLIVVLIVVGVLLWLVNTFIPMDAKIKSILNALVVIGVILWLLQAFGLLTSLNAIHIGK